MQEVLHGAVRGDPVSSETAVTALNDVGVHELQPHQAEQILRQRIIAL